MHACLLVCLFVYTLIYLSVGLFVYTHTCISPLVLCSPSVSSGVKEKSSNKEVLRGILKKIPKSVKFSRTDWEMASRQKLRTTLRVPFIRGFYFSRLKLHQKGRSVSVTLTGH